MYLTVTILIVAAALALLVWASASIRSGVYVRSLCRKRTTEKEVALTFDDGPHPNTLRVLEVLERHGARATFFLIGERVEKYPDIVRKIVEGGHTLGIHTHAHSWKFPFMGRRGVEQELELSRQAVRNITGESVALFRPPFGVTNPTIAKVVGKGGYTTIGWDVRSLDTIGQEHGRVVRRIIRKMRPGSVILLHDDRDGSGNLLEKVLKEIKEQNYKIITLGEMFEPQK